MCLRNAKVNNPNLPKLQWHYSILCSRTNRAAEKAMNHWWGTKAAEAEECMRVAKQNGRGGSLSQELRFLHNRISIPAALSLLVKYDIDRLTSMFHKLDIMAEQFSDVLNCEKTVDNDILLQIPRAPSSPEAEALCELLMFAKIIGVLRHLQKSKVPGEDGISVELLQLRGSAVVEAELGGHGVAASDSPEGCMLSPLEIFPLAVTYNWCQDWGRVFRIERSTAL